MVARAATAIAAAQGKAAAIYHTLLSAGIAAFEGYIPPIKAQENACQLSTQFLPYNTGFRSPERSHVEGG